MLCDTWALLHLMRQWVDHYPEEAIPTVRKYVRQVTFMSENTVCDVGLLNIQNTNIPSDIWEDYLKGLEAKDEIECYKNRWLACAAALEVNPIQARAAWKCLALHMNDENDEVVSDTDYEHLLYLPFILHLVISVNLEVVKAEKRHKSTFFAILKSFMLCLWNVILRVA